MVPLMQKMGLSDIQATPYELYEIANNLIVPLMRSPQGLTDEEIHIGISKFHTSFLPYVNEAVNRYGVDKKELIKKVSDINCVNPDRDLFFEVAKEML
jgi:4-hydroxy 2-oxovalerate aldolase